MEVEIGEVLQALRMARSLSLLKGLYGPSMTGALKKLVSANVGPEKAEKPGERGRKAAMPNAAVV